MVPVLAYIFFFWQIHSFVNLREISAKCPEMLYPHNGLNLWREVHGFRRGPREYRAWPCRADPRGEGSGPELARTQIRGERPQAERSC